jgi:hypothetical protein
MTKIINVFGGPGIGKSTVAAGVFYHLKLQSISCELVTEYAKELVWEDNKHLLKNQHLLFLEQLKRQLRLIDKVDYVVTDSPLLLNAVYLTFNHDLYDSYYEATHDYMLQSWYQFDNKNYLLERKTDFQQLERAHSQDDSVLLDEIIYSYCDKWCEHFLFLENQSTDTAVKTIIKDLTNAT